MAKRIEKEIKENKREKAKKVFEFVPDFDIMNEMGAKPNVQLNQKSDPVKVENIKALDTND